MRRLYFIAIFFSTHVFFIFFQIHKHSKLIKLSYQKQKYEQQKERLAQNIQDLTQQLHELKKRSSIKEFAQKNLNMRKIKLSQVKKLDSVNQTTRAQ